MADSALKAVAYSVSPVSPICFADENIHSFDMCPILPQLKQNPERFSYLNGTHAFLLSSVSIKIPLRKGFCTSMDTRNLQ